uniref:Uncharacterized protein n=1 Tax=Siphoviridae sp. ctWDo30 TaxID=2826360 RepID=A0A8S5N5X8_9CAUD|nr:MAG TPA: hypothetical protein [Siphoviridae sp. ctWDo30]
MEELHNLLAKLNENDSKIIKQVCAILYRYLEKQGRV